jgi:hypothetical protein
MRGSAAAPANSAVCQWPVACVIMSMLTVAVQCCALCRQVTHLCVAELYKQRVDKSLQGLHCGAPQHAHRHGRATAARRIWVSRWRRSRGRPRCRAGCGSRAGRALGHSRRTPAHRVLAPAQSCSCEAAANVSVMVSQHKVLLSVPQNTDSKAHQLLRLHRRTAGSPHAHSMAMITTACSALPRHAGLTGAAPSPAALSCRLAMLRSGLSAA